MVRIVGFLRLVFVRFKAKPQDCTDKDCAGVKHTPFSEKISFFFEVLFDFLGFLP